MGAERGRVALLLVLSHLIVKEEVILSEAKYLISKGAVNKATVILRERSDRRI